VYIYKGVVVVVVDYKKKEKIQPGKGASVNSLLLIKINS